MSETENINVVKKIYEAFGKGDIDTIINNLAEYFVWRFRRSVNNPLCR